ncbi:MAG: hypothetical protein IKN55_09495 [Oscillospiraceae bacterium]|nr:hypothetical protein [Oscillospiraceae bacterium]
MKLLKIFLASAVMAVQYVSAIFLTEAISYKSNVLMLLYTVLTAGVWTLVLLSEDTRTVLAKWLFSVPLCYPVLLCYWNTHYAVRALNWAFPGYGRQSAGGGFAGAMLLLLLTALCTVGLIAALARHPKPDQKAEAIRLCIGGGCTLAVIAGAVLLATQFPPYPDITAGV